MLYKPSPKQESQLHDSISPSAGPQCTFSCLLATTQHPLPAQVTADQSWNIGVRRAIMVPSGVSVQEIPKALKCEVILQVSYSVAALPSHWSSSGPAWSQGDPAEGRAWTEEFPAGRRETSRTRVLPC